MIAPTIRKQLNVPKAAHNHYHIPKAESFEFSWACKTLNRSGCG